MLEGRELEAATVAARLRDFRAQPDRFGPRYLQGLEPLPEGGIVLRLAQGRMPAAMPDLREAEARDLRLAAEEFVRRICLWDHADHYQALCARRDAAQESVKENYHLLMALLHPDRQEEGSAWPADAAQRVNRAYAVVGDEKARREYDVHLRATEPKLRAPIPPRATRRPPTEVPFAKALIVVAMVAAALIGVGLAVHDDEWSERSVLEASWSRLRAQPLPGSDRPRYVGSSVAAPRASDAVYDGPEPFALLKPLIRAIAGEEAKAWAPAPRLEAPAASSVAPAAVAPEPVRVAQATPQPAPPVAPAQAPASTSAPAPRADPAATAPAPVAAAPADAARATNRGIEDLVVALVDSYQAGDMERLVGLLEPDAGFWRTVQMRRAYGDFFRATKVRRLRIEKLAWDSRKDAAHAKGEATVLAEYFGEAAPVERRVDLELDIVLRDGQARIRRLSLFPDAQ